MFKQSKSEPNYVVQFKLSFQIDQFPHFREWLCWIDLGEKGLAKWGKGRPPLSFEYWKSCCSNTVSFGPLCATTTAPSAWVPHCSGEIKGRGWVGGLQSTSIPENCVSQIPTFSHKIVQYQQHICASKKKRNSAVGLGMGEQLGRTRTGIKTMCQDKSRERKKRRVSPTNKTYVQDGATLQDIYA